MRPTAARSFALALLGLCAACANALEVPWLQARVNDNAGALKRETVAQLEDALKRHEAETTNQVAVLIIRSLEGESLEEFSHRVAGTWKLGQKGKDNGVLLLVAVADRKLRIEVGYGLEPVLPDGRSGRIIREIITPRFRSGDFDGGVRDGVAAILTTLSGQEPSFPPPAQDESSGDGAGILAFFMVALATISLFGPALEPQKTAAVVELLATGGWVAAFYLWLGARAALIAGVAHLLWFSVLYAVFRTNAGKRFLKSSGGGYGSGYSSSDWSSGGSWGGGGDSGFSGGGGSFGGGGASGSW